MKKLIKEINKNFKRFPFQPGAIINWQAKGISILLEDVQYYGSWIEGQGADIRTYHAMDDDRIVGAFLPYYSKKKFRVDYV